MTACAAIAIFFSLVFFELAVLYGSCVIGAFYAVRGMSYFLGGYPNEFIIYESLLNENFKN